MRLGGLLAVLILVLVTLVQALPETFQASTQEARDNTRNHMAFTGQLAAHEAELGTLERQYNSVANLPERMARIEERLELMGKMMFAVLTGILALIGKEAWFALRSLRHPRNHT